MQAHVLLAFILVAVVVVVVCLVSACATSFTRCDRVSVRVWFFTHTTPSLQCHLSTLAPMYSYGAHTKSVSVRLIESINHKLDRIPAVHKGGGAGVVW